MEVVTATEHM